jgi:drug/metabolite transporter (DMT)-like permease
MALMLLAAACVGIQAFFVKLASPDIDPVTLAFLRFLASYLLLRTAMAAGWVDVRVVNRKLVWIRGILGGIGSLCYFFAIAHTRLSNAVVLFYTYPLFAGLISRGMQGAVLTRPVLATLGASLFGIYVLVRPSFDTLLIGDVFGLLSGLTAAGAIVSLKASRRTDSSWTIFHYYNIAGMLVSLPLLITQWTTPPLHSLPVLLGVLLFSILGQLGVTYAYRYTTTAEGGVLSMFGAVVGSGLGIGLLGEPATASFLAGAAILVLCGIYLTMRGTEEGRSS